MFWAIKQFFFFFFLIEVTQGSFSECKGIKLL